VWTRLGVTHFSFSKSLSHFVALLAEDLDSWLELGSLSQPDLLKLLG
jgi:hypothetical protein